jgi:hypothetical protein
MLGYTLQLILASIPAAFVGYVLALLFRFISSDFPKL